MDGKGTTLAENPLARQDVETYLGFSCSERLESHRKRFGLMLLPLSCLMSCALGIGLLPLLDPNVGNMPWAKSYLSGVAVWAGGTLAVWMALSWLSIPVWKFRIFVAGSFILCIARAESGGNAGWVLTLKALADTKSSKLAKAARNALKTLERS